MMKHLDWQQRPGRFLAMTGHTIDSFFALLPYFREAHDDYLSAYHLTGKPRSGYRRYVMYKNAPLASVEERLAFTLSYLKLNPLQEHHADLFGIDQKQCNELVHGLKTILDKALEYAGAVPAQTDKELQALLSERSSDEDTILLHDGTEREIPRPCADDLQEEHYSGKKKKHTVKNAVIISSCCLVLFVSQTFSGRIHDKKIADDSYTIPSGYTLVQDTGYQGYAPKGVRVIQPTKKPLGKDLTSEQKLRNREIAAYRIRIEHVIGGIKRARIVKDECRIRKDGFVDNVMRTCAALHNFRMSGKIVGYQNKLT